MAFCNSCGKELNDSSIFCPFCGAPIEKTKVFSEPEHAEQPVDNIINKTGSVEIEPELPEAPDEPVKQEEQIPKGLLSDDSIDNVVPSNDSSSSPVKTKKAKKAKKTETDKPKRKLIPLIILLLVFLIIIAPVGTYFATYLMAKNKVKDKDFYSADKLLFIKPITSYHDYLFVLYVEAGTQMKDNQLNEAALKFYSISSYEDSYSLAQTCSTDYAEQLSNKEQYEEELDWGHQVAGFDADLGREIELGARYHIAVNELAAYNDYSSNSILDINKELKEIYDLGYEKAYHDYVESTAATALYYANYAQYEKAIETINPIKDFNTNTSNKYKEIVKTIYDHGVDLYNKGRFVDARDCFDMISSYSNAASYRAVCSKLNRAITSDDYAQLIKEAFGYTDVPNVEDAIFKDGWLTIKYLVGEWRSSGDYYSFSMTDTSTGYSFITSIPMIDFGNNNTFYFTGKKLYLKSVGLCFTFSISSYNEMSIYSEADGRTYKFYRQ